MKMKRKNKFLILTFIGAICSFFALSTFNTCSDSKLVKADDELTLNDYQYKKIFITPNLETEIIENRMYYKFIVDIDLLYPINNVDNFKTFNVSGIWDNNEFNQIKIDIPNTPQRTYTTGRISLLNTNYNEIILHINTALPNRDVNLLDTPLIIYEITETEDATNLLSFLNNNSTIVENVSQVEVLENEINSLNDLIAELRNEIINKSIQITNFQNQIIEYENSISSLENQVLQLNSQITNLQNQLSALTEDYNSLLSQYNNTIKITQTEYDNNISNSYSEGYSNGYTAGYNEGFDLDSTTGSIFNGILSVGLLPINVFLSFFNFEILGINISALVGALLSICVVIIIIRTITGGKND